MAQWTAKVAGAFHATQRAASRMGRRKVKPTPFGEKNRKVSFNASGVAQVGPRRFVFIDNHDSSVLPVTENADDGVTLNADGSRADSGS